MLSTLNINKFLFSLISLFQLSLGFSYSQISIQFPAEKSVFQRNNNNLGNIHVSGNLNQEADRVEGRLIPRVAGQGTQTDWKIIDSSIDGLSFTGLIEGNGGWYKLEIRSVRNNSTIENTTIERVGIGEVFVIAGQSNAQGDGNNPNAKGAIDERVLAFDQNFIDRATYTTQNLPINFEPGKFSKIESYTNIGPNGYTAWCYGELGDLLIKKINVPVMFYNAALSGTSTGNWVASINGQDTYHVNLGYKFEKFMPYLGLKKTLNSIISIFGIRAILWHQGESDTSGDVSEQVYFTNMKTLIQETRNNTGVKIPWVVSRVSRYFGRTSSTIISSQNKVIANIESVWPGPSTDDIQINRPDGAHFENTFSENGLSKLAEAWNQSLTNSFFTQSTPIAPTGILEIKYTCNSQSDVKLFFEKAFQNYYWNNNSKDSQLRITNGSYNAKVVDGYGNFIFSNKLIFTNLFPKDKPVISPVNSLIGCVGKSLELQSTVSKYDVNWNTGKIGNNLTVNNQDLFFAYFRSSQGCLSERSNNLLTKFVPPPTKPNVEIVNSDGYECNGNQLTFKVNNPNNYEVLWSNGLKTETITLNSKPTQPLKVNLYSNFDCPSIDSDTAKFKFIDVPKTPVIEKSSPFTIKVSVLEKVDRFNWYLNNKLISSQNSNEFHFPEDGFYSVKAVKTAQTPSNKTLECISGFSSQLGVTNNSKLYGLSIFPNPTTNRKIYISSAIETKSVEVSIFNLIGEKIFETNIETLFDPIEINLTNKPMVGLYYVRLKFSGLSRTFPIIFE